MMVKSIQPHRPSHLSPYTLTCLNALVQANLARCISLGGAFGLFHYLDYRATQDVDAWWADGVTEDQRQAVVQVL
jgi:hypothetical protein